MGHFTSIAQTVTSATRRSRATPTASEDPAAPPMLPAEVDVLVVGSGTGLAAALAAHEQGLSVAVIEKASRVGGSAARSGGALWVPGNSALKRDGADVSRDKAEEYLRSVVGDSAPEDRWQSYLDDGPAAIDMLERLTPLRFTWARGYSDYHPEHPGGSPAGRSIDPDPLDARMLGEHRALLSGGTVDSSVPVPITGKDYKWLNLMVKKPWQGIKLGVLRGVQGVGGLALGREYVALGQALIAGMYAGCLRAGIPVLTDCPLIQIIADEADSEVPSVQAAVVRHRGEDKEILVRGGLILASGGFDHDMELRTKEQSSRLEDVSLGVESNEGDALKLAEPLGADTSLLEQAWWFPAIAPLPGELPSITLAERSLPGSFMVDRHGRRFINEAIDYMSFGQRVLEREKQGDPVGQMWLVFDQEYRNSYLFASQLPPRMSLPASWYREGIAVKASSPTALAQEMGIDEAAFAETFSRFQTVAALGRDDEFGRGDSAYDRYYGDPTVTPNPTLRPLNDGTLYAVKMVLSDLGTCGGLTVDASARVLARGGDPIDGLYAVGNAAANMFGHRYPGAGATLGQGVVAGYTAARHIREMREALRAPR